MGTMTSLRSRLQHHLNPLHVMCRLRSMGLNPATAKGMCRAYEILLYRVILG